MRRWLPWIVAALAAAAVVHLVAVQALPRVIMGVAMRRIAALSGVNAPAYAPRADAQARTIVRPSPDLLYASCVFDLTSAPLRITADPPHDSYWSLSMFAANTDNFYKINDREAGGAPVDLVLAKAGSTVEVPAGARLVESPTFRGIVLTRTLVDDDARFAELDAVRRSFRCAPLSSNGAR